MAVDLNVRNLAVITVCRAKRIIETIFVTDHGLDQARNRHLKKIAKRQWQTGKPVKGERSNQDLWRHVRRMNEDAAHQVAHRIAGVCARYPGCVLPVTRLRKISSGVRIVTTRLTPTLTPVRMSIIEFGRDARKAGLMEARREQLLSRFVPQIWL